MRLWRLVDGLAIGAGIWVSGFRAEVTDPSGRQVGRGAAVAVSRDGGRTWLVRKLPEEVVVVDGAGTGSAAIATADGRTVYAVGRVGGALRIYRSDDAGATWHRTNAAWDVGPRRIAAAIGPDGALFVQSVSSSVLLLLRSSDRGESVREEPFGPGAGARGGARRVGAGRRQARHPAGGDRCVGRA